MNEEGNPKEFIVDTVEEIYLEGFFQLSLGYHFHYIITQYCALTTLRLNNKNYAGIFITVNAINIPL